MTARTVEVRLTGDATSYVGAVKRAATETSNFASTANQAGQHVQRAGQSTKQVSGFFDGYRTSAARAREETRKAGVEFNGLARAGKYVHDVMGMALGSMVGFVGAQAVITGVTQAWHQLVGATIEFDRNMRNVQSITKESDSEIAHWEGQILNLSNRLPQTAAELSAGFYDIASSGFYGGDALLVLTASAQAASAGISDTATSARGITGVLNAYGESAIHAGEVSDVLFQTVNLGVISFGELAGNIGDFVGSASALGVPFRDAAAALAAMTLSGIKADESATSLNRVLSSLMQPSEQLAFIFKEWGYNSGTAAVKALGLRGVMEKLRIETGGQADTLAALFPEMRAMRGVLALMAADGANYARTQRDIGDAQRTAGATAAALAEQQKSLGYQLDVVKNNMVNAFLKVGAMAAPVLAGLLADARDFGDQVLTLGTNLAHDLAPAAEDVIGVLSDLADIAGEVFDALAPVLAPVLGVGLGAVVITLRGLAATLQAVTSFARDNELVIHLLAIALGTYLAVAATRAAAALGSLVLDKLAFGAFALAGRIDGLTMATTKAGGALELFKSKMTATVSASSAAATGVAVFAAMVTSGLMNISRWADNADARVDKFMQRFDADTLRGQGDAMAALSAKAEAASAKVKPVNVANPDGRPNMSYGTTAVIEGGAAILGIETSRQRDIADANAYNKQLDEVHEKRMTIVNNALAYMKRVGKEPKFDLAKVLGYRDKSMLGGGALKFVEGQERAIDKIVGAAKRAGYDLTKTGKAGIEEARNYGRYVREIGDAAGYSNKQVASMSADQIAALQEEAQAAAEMQKAVVDAFTGASDVVQEFSGKTAEEIGGKGNVTKFYVEHLDQTRKFLANYKTAVAQGYDPALLTRILTAGPEAAGGFLQTLVDNNSAAFTQMVNDAEGELGRLAAFAGEVQRLQTVAMRQETYDPGALSQAIAITQQKVLQGTSATTESIAASLKLTPEQVRAIAETYKIPLPKDQVFEIQVLVNEATATTDLGTIAAAIDKIPKSVTSTAKIDDPQSAREWWDKLKERLLQVPGLQETVAKIDDPQQAQLWWIALTEKINNAPKNPLITAHTAGKEEVDALADRIAGMRDKDVTVTVHGKTTTIPWSLVKRNNDGSPDLDGNPDNSRATGGQVLPFKSYKVNERGDEVLVMGGRGGRILSHVDSMRALGMVSGHAMAGARGAEGRGGWGAVNVRGGDVVLNGNADAGTIATMRREQQMRDDRLVRKIRTTRGKMRG